MSSNRLTLVLAILATTPAAMADVCVTCTGPAATYACAVKKADEIEAFAGSKALSKICTQVLKRKGQHTACQVLDGGACNGTPTTVGWKEVKEALASDDDDPKPSAGPKQEKAAPATSEKTPAKLAAPTPGKPPPVAEKASPEPLPPSMAQTQDPKPEAPSLGDKIKDNAEKTWKCVSSFFGQC